MRALPPATQGKARQQVRQARTASQVRKARKRAKGNYQQQPYGYFQQKQTLTWQPRHRAFWHRLARTKAGKPLVLAGIRADGAAFTLDGQQACNKRHPTTTQLQATPSQRLGTPPVAYLPLLRTAHAMRKPFHRCGGSAGRFGGICTRDTQRYAHQSPASRLSCMARIATPAPTGQIVKESALAAFGQWVLWAAYLVASSGIWRQTC